MMLDEMDKQGDSMMKTIQCLSQHTWGLCLKEGWVQVYMKTKKGTKVAIKWEKHKHEKGTFEHKSNET